MRAAHELVVEIQNNAHASALITHVNVGTHKFLMAEVRDLSSN